MRAQWLSPSVAELVRKSMEALIGADERSRTDEGDSGCCDAVSSAGLLLIRFYGGFELSTKMKRSLTRPKLYHRTWSTEFLYAWQVVYYISLVNQ